MPLHYYDRYSIIGVVKRKTGDDPMKKSSLGPLGEAEMEVLQHVWEQGGLVTVAAIHEQVARKRKVAYTTIMTIMRKLADKGYLRYEKDGNTYLYEAARPPGEVKHSLLTGILGKVFGGSPVELVESLVKYETLSEKERSAIKRMLDLLEDDDDPVG
jgi:predicted transcriptional regulator